MPARPCTVAQLTSIVRGALAAAPELEDALVEGEISNLRMASSGHMYFTLKDRWAALRCVCFRTDVARMPFRPADGMTVIAHGAVEVYDQGGAYQLHVDRLEPSGVGALALAVRELSARLATEGLFAEGRKRQVPLLPRRVAVVTSLGGAAVRDVCTVISRRAPGVQVVIASAPVQGAEAPDALVAALGRAGTAPGVDVVLLVRGGGAMEDLAAFQTERVARAIAACPVPVVTGIGHESDTTIADSVADRRAATPSAAAEVAVPVTADLRDELTRRQLRLGQSLRRGVDARRDRVERIGLRLDQLSPLRRLGGLRRDVDTRTSRLRLALVAELAIKRRSAETARNRLVLASPGRQVPLGREALRGRRDRLIAAGGVTVAGRRGELAARRGRLEGLSPRRTLARGYSITIDAVTGGVITDASATAGGQRLRTLLARGEVSSQVTGEEETVTG